MNNVRAPTLHESTISVYLTLQYWGSLPRIPSVSPGQASPFPDEVLEAAKA